MTRMSAMPGVRVSKGLVEEKIGVPVWLFWITPNAVRCVVSVAAAELAIPAAPFHVPVL